MNYVIPRYFLGTNSPEGFFSYYSYLIDLKTANRVYVLKGGPGTGKSSFMKHIADNLASEGIPYHLIHCGSDPKSLDGVYFPSIKCAIVDGTAPHVIDPVYPAAVEEIINLGEYWDAPKIRENKEMIISLNSEIKTFYAKVCKYLSAAKQISSDTYAAAFSFLNIEKLSSYAMGFTDKFFKQKDKKAVITKRIIRNITSSGIIGFESELAARAEKVFIIKDLYGLAPILMGEIMSSITAIGYDAEVYYNFQAPDRDIDALFFPERSIAVIVSNDTSPYDGEYYRCIHIRRFVDMEGLKHYKIRLRFNAKATDLIMEEAIESLAQANKIHEKLESYYIPNMNFKEIDKQVDKYSKLLLQYK
ncbi:MAG: hypothetical protein Q8865_10170 [Bacillota bacterium]|nr:hypothetical protein [Bacillota bacterium]